VILNPDTGGTAIPTTFVSATQLSATVPGNFMANFGSTNSVGVQNPPPGGGKTVTTSAVTLPTFTVIAPAPPNDNFASAQNITSTTFTDTKDSSGATTETNDPTPLCSQDARIPFVTGRSNTIWYKVVPTGSGTANLDTIGSSYDTVLSVWSGTSQAGLTAVACNDDIRPGVVIVSQLTNVALNAGTTYYIMVSSFGRADPNPLAFGGKSVLNFSFTGTIGGASPDFTITPQAPTTVTVNSGTSATYTLAIAGTNGFASNVNLSCSLTAAATACAANPATVAPGSSTTITVTTTTHQFAPPVGGPRRFGPWQRVVPLMLLLLALLGLSAHSRRRRLAILIPLSALVLFVVLQAVGCSKSNTGPPQHGTQAGSYTVTVTGTSGAVTHTTTVTLAVN
jgi:hypothetical protein